MSDSKPFSLEWYQGTGTVYEHLNEHTYEIGTVSLKTLTNAIVGCVYYHHILPVLEINEKWNFEEYQKALKSHQRKIKRITRRLKKYQKIYPGLAEAKLAKIDPFFIDVAIPINFPVPFLRSDPYNKAIIEKITPYIFILNPLRLLEVIKETDSGVIII
ncbi:MAG: hypothetical protein ACTSYB_06495 [Candidatus Helarchaeota archaeon]